MTTRALDSERSLVGTIAAITGGIMTATQWKDCIGIGLILGSAISFIGMAIMCAIADGLL